MIISFDNIIAIFYIFQTIASDIEIVEHFVRAKRIIRQMFAHILRDH